MSYGSPPPDVEGMTALKVDNLTYRILPETLCRVFEKYGRVGEVYIPRDRYTKESRGFAFVRFFDKREAENAMDAIDGTLLDGRELRVQITRYRRPPDSMYIHRGAPPPRRSGGGYGRRSRSRTLEDDDKLFDDLDTSSTNNLVDRQKTGSPPVSPARPEPTSGAPEKQVATRAKSNMTDHQKRRDARQPMRSESIQSGPSSPIELENFEDWSNDTALQSSRAVRHTVCADLCAPPLKPLILLPEDKYNLTEWLKRLWSTTVDSGAQITPDHFEWYYYQDRVFGLMVDLQSGLICSGKMLLGCFMKKPLWVDPNATTVFHLLTSSVSVTVDCSESCYSPGQSFMVPSGHAYSIHNLSAELAMLCFTRIFAEESDE